MKLQKFSQHQLLLWLNVLLLVLPGLVTADLPSSSQLGFSSRSKIDTLSRWTSFSCSDDNNNNDNVKTKYDKRMLFSLSEGFEKASILHHSPPRRVCQQIRSHLPKAVQNQQLQNDHSGWITLRGGNTNEPSNTIDNNETESEDIGATTNTTTAVALTESSSKHKSNTKSSGDWIDSTARSINLAMVWVVLGQVILTMVHSCSRQIFQFASKFVKQDTLSAARSIRQILESMDDHGIVDVLARHEPAQVLISIFALSKLQAACQHKERLQEYPKLETESDLALLQDLYDYLPFASAAYGWKFNLATSGKWHKGDHQALVKMTQVDPSDIVTVNWEARPNRPAFYIVRDHKRKRIVLVIRGTWSAQDVLTDLCCSTEEYHASSSSSSFSNRHRWGRQLALRAHSGILLAARGVALLAENIVEQELEEHPDYSLLLVGHSLGGGAAAVLGTLWAETFSKANVTVYTYGSACVFPESFHREYRGANIVSVLVDGDPFSCLSLGHIADVSGALDCLCENTEFRRSVIVHTDEPLRHVGLNDLEWCSRSMREIQSNLTLTEKLYPPGRLLFIPPKTKHSKHVDAAIQQVPPVFFQYWKLGPRMFDLTRHTPKVYETGLRKSIARAKQNILAQQQPSTKSNR